MPVEKRRRRRRRKWKRRWTTKRQRAWGWDGGLKDCWTNVGDQLYSIDVFRYWQRFEINDLLKRFTYLFIYLVKCVHIFFASIHTKGTLYFFKVDTWNNKLCKSVQLGHQLDHFKFSVFKLYRVASQTQWALHHLNCWARRGIFIITNSINKNAWVDHSDKVDRYITQPRPKAMTISNQIICFWDNRNIQVFAMPNSQPSGQTVKTVTLVILWTWCESKTLGNVPVNENCACWGVFSWN